MGLVFVVFPTANLPRAEATALKWVARGYGTGFLVGSGEVDPLKCVWRSGRAGGWEETSSYPGVYPGYYVSVNMLAKHAVRIYGADAVVCAGDDMDPDPNKTAAELLAECHAKYPDDCYVMQPTGDPQGQIDGVPAAARICGSPWLGAAYVRRGYGGSGPYPADYYHFFGDEELKNTAEHLGILWQRPDLSHFHYHWSFGHSKAEPYQRANSQKWWGPDFRVFEERRAAGWPGHALAAP